jgi:hypothetical protein
LAPQTAIRDWLLTGPAQVSAGPERGGVVGWLDDAGRPAFVYPEITGCYLTCLAFMAVAGESARGQVRERARRAVRWLDAHAAGPADPLTRSYLAPAPADWRNEALFAFDLGMVVRGLDAVRDVADGPERGRARRRVLALLARFPTGSDIPPWRPRRGAAGGPPVPARWSTRPGPFLLKLAAALLLPPAKPTLDRLDRAARRLHRRWSRGTGRERGHPELHPMLYGLEGLFLFGLARRGREAWGRAEAGYRRVMIAQAADGGLPARLGDPRAESRSDVNAQALRLGCALRSVGRLRGPRWDERLEGLAAALGRAVRSDGAVAFVAARRPAHWNTWCAMFAYQALAFHDAWRRARTIEPRWLELLV